ncbi:CaiB/BaiF CoA transferase family protein [Brevibacterium sp. VCM10]|uniref:CaiB/BaiF CoA transferase family protein n=1 Tax=Brevibacterium sp. VCM10 TaxID=1381751 RepID=UPI000472D25F|nr:CoA transferase [Brevibacterium sp. VCM10]
MEATAENSGSTQNLPLSGVVVVELGDSASAPFAGKTLAELGAEVWKIERSGGDSARGWGPSTWKGSGGAYHALNRRKKSVRVDIKDADELARLQDFICDHADVFLSNLRPGTSVKYGLDAESLRARNPRLVHAEIGAFGGPGPLDSLPGYDPLLQAFSGIMNLTGEANQPPSRAGVSIIDFGSGMWAVIGIVSALFRRNITQEGAAVTGSLFETAIAWMSVGVANYTIDGEPGGRHGSGVRFIVPHRAYSASDGDLVISAANDVLFAQLATALDHPEWAEDERFATNAGRLKNRDGLDELIGSIVSTRTRADWRVHLESAGVAVAPVQTTAEMVEHEHTRALGMIAAQSPDEVAVAGLALSFDGVRPRPLEAVHEIGEDNDEWRRMAEPDR